MASPEAYTPKQLWTGTSEPTLPADIDGQSLHVCREPCLGHTAKLAVGNGCVSVCVCINIHININMNSCTINVTL